MLDSTVVCRRALVVSGGVGTLLHPEPRAQIPWKWRTCRQHFRGPKSKIYLSNTDLISLAPFPRHPRLLRLVLQRGIRDTWDDPKTSHRFPAHGGSHEADLRGRDTDVGAGGRTARSSRSASPSSSRSSRSRRRRSVGRLRVLNPALS